MQNTGGAAHNPKSQVQISPRYEGKHHVSAVSLPQAARPSRRPHRPDEVRNGETVRVAHEGSLDVIAWKLFNPATGRGRMPTCRHRRAEMAQVLEPLGSEMGRPASSLGLSVAVFKRGKGSESAERPPADVARHTLLPRSGRERVDDE